MSLLLDCLELHPDASKAGILIAMAHDPTPLDQVTERRGKTAVTLEEDRGTDPWAVVPTTPTVAQSTPATPSEEIRRIQVDEEDRLAFRVGVNLITLLLMSVGVYLLIRYFWG